MLFVLCSSSNKWSITWFNERKNAINKKKFISEILLCVNILGTHKIREIVVVNEFRRHNFIGYKLILRNNKEKTFKIK